VQWRRDDPSSRVCGGAVHYQQRFNARGLLAVICPCGNQLEWMNAGRNVGRRM
jgi:hypothetical protein